jgi:hypothetical protein
MFAPHDRPDELLASLQKTATFVGKSWWAPAYMQDICRLPLTISSVSPLFEHLAPWIYSRLRQQIHPPPLLRAREMVVSIPNVPDAIAQTWPAPNYDNPVTRSRAVIALLIIGLLLTVATVAARVYVRIVVKKCFGNDDIFAVVALVCLCIFLVAVQADGSFCARHALRPTRSWSLLASWDTAGTAMSTM